MKKNTLKAFTLVEMLIVIVIIGILIASLMPRMQSAQGRARDVSRKNDLAQIQTAIITSQQDRGLFPGMESSATTKASQGIPVDQIADALKTAGMTQVPGDPNQSNEVTGLGNATGTGQYIYMVTKRNSVSNAGFALMAKTEVEGGSNWVVCNGASSMSQGKISVDDDLANVTTCTSLNLADTDNLCGIHSGDCRYDDIADLRYLLVY